MTLFQHVLEALRSIASKKHHGKGCQVSNCGDVCLCGPCHARVALEMIEQAPSIDAAEREMTTRAIRPHGRWRQLAKVSPSGKTLFVCLSCGRESYSPDKTCPKPVTLYNRQDRECVDWEPSEFEVQ